MPEERVEEITRRIAQDSTMGKILTDQVRNIVTTYRTCDPE